MNTSLSRALKVWLLFSGGKGTDRISITLQSACCASHVAINNSYFDLMGYLLLMDFKKLLQRWIYVLLSAVYRSQDEQRNKMTYSRSFSKPGVFKRVIPGTLPFYSGSNLQRHYKNSQIPPWTSTIPIRKYDGSFTNIEVWTYSWRKRRKKLLTLGTWYQDSTEMPQNHLVETPWKGHWLHRQSCRDLLNSDQHSFLLPTENFFETISDTRLNLRKLVVVVVYYEYSIVYSLL